MQEIEDQPNSWASSIQEYNIISKDLNKFFNNHSNIYFVGCGSSYHAGLIGEYVYNNISTGKKSSCLLSSDILMYPEETLHYADKNDVYFLISRTGKTGETVLVSEVLKKANVKTISITAYPDSEIIKKCDFGVVLEGSQEKSITATKSMTSFTLFLLKLIFGFHGKKFDDEDFLNSTGKVFKKIEFYKEIIQKIIYENNFNKFVFLGSKPFKGLVKESELKTKEMSTTDTESNNPLEFRHGHKSILSDKSLVVIFLSEKGYEYEIKAAGEFKKIGSKVLLIFNKHKLALKKDFYDYSINLNINLEELSISIIYTLFGQLIGYYQALKKKLDPSKPRNLEFYVPL
ncbi:MAG: SIS domain-containing protein [Actinobacteria bacterium]|nr:SIS domain-containing protein [Actinomycetota bacterium]